MNFATLEDLNAKILKLKYINDYSFIIILPNEQSGFTSLESNLKNHDFKEIIDRLAMKEVDVKISRFTIEFELKLNDLLEEVCTM